MSNPKATRPQRLVRCQRKKKKVTEQQNEILNSKVWQPNPKGKSKMVMMEIRNSEMKETFAHVGAVGSGEKELASTEKVKKRPKRP